MKKFIKRLFNQMGFDLRLTRHQYQNIPDAQFYKPLFSPWLGYGKFQHYLNMAQQQSLVSADRCHILYTLALQALELDGDIWECGVYKGGTASMFAEMIRNSPQNDSMLHLFDTFSGMPETNLEKDIHRKGDFMDTSLPGVKECVGDGPFVVYHQGLIPETFKGQEDSKIAFAHVDVDIYQSVKNCCEFIMPRLVQGGIVVFDDYGFPSCPGAREAVDEFFRERKEQPLILPTGQAIIFNSF